MDNKTMTRELKTRNALERKFKENDYKALTLVMKKTGKAITITPLGFVAEYVPTYFEVTDTNGDIDERLIAHNLTELAQNLCKFY